jgi:uncharacterized protein
MTIDIQLNETPKGVTIIQGFPGFGMVGSISTEFLIQHLKMTSIGNVKISEMMPVVAVHEGKIVAPAGIYYDKENNIVVLNFLTKGTSHEWEFAELVKTLAEKLEAKEIIAIEGVTSQEQATEKEIYAFSRNVEGQEKLKKLNFKLLNEGIIMGVSAALFLDVLPCNITAFFSMTASTLPDSNAAAEVIKGLDKYLGLKVDYAPLYEQAKLFEEKVKTIVDQSQKAVDEKDKNMHNYVS